MRKKHNKIKLVGAFLILVFSVFCFSVDSSKIVVEDIKSNNEPYIYPAAIDDCGFDFSWCMKAIVQCVEINQPPEAPNITGPTRGSVGVEYEWTFVSTDPDGDNVTYYVDWGDECGGAEYHGPYPSGDEVALSHIYTFENTLIINAMAIDENGAESNWTYFEVTMPRNSILLNTLFLQLLERFPNAFPILQYIYRV